MPTIKELDIQKRKLHEDVYKKKYPNGVFSVQVRENYQTGNLSVYLRWGTKLGFRVFSNAYYRESISVGGRGEIIPRIEGSFGNVNNYSTIEKALTRYYKLYDKHKIKLSDTQIRSYLWACKKCGVEITDELIKRYHIK